MADSFDTNVARRKPNVANKTKPVHPWHVSPHETEEAVSTDAAPPIGEKTPAAPEPAAHAAPVAAKKERKRPSRPKKAGKAPQSAPVRNEAVSGLSSTINIHSNFCKLDNDVSDKLLPRLSPSAQSVYLRLYRQSYGWNRNWASESLPKLSKSCNQSLQTIRKAIKELEGIGCISKETSDYHRATVYRVLLPSEMQHDKSLTSSDGVSTSDMQSGGAAASSSQNLEGVNDLAQVSDSSSFNTSGVKNLDGETNNIGGQESVIQSLYFAETSIYTLLESGGSTPINITKYMFDKHLGEAVRAVDEFYSSIGFSVVSRAQYRKSIFDYLELIDAGFSSDDIGYAVRWTFMNSRTRPESFSLIKHTMHLAMNDFISELKSVSGEKAAVKKKQAVLDKTLGSGDDDASAPVAEKDFALWTSVREQLKDQVNEHSYRAFIEPLTLLSSEEGGVTLAAPGDSLGWIDDHYRGIIEEVYADKAKKEVTVQLAPAEA